MCVIVVCLKERPTDHQIDQMWAKNPDGGGIAERKTVGKKSVMIWRKGLNKEELRKAISEASYPFVAHFRKKSIGDAIPELTHPFEICHETSNRLFGETENELWFHNGTWHTWDSGLIDAALKSHIPLPLGDWSDSKAMAWLASIAGLGVLNVLEAKGVAFGPKSLQFFNGKEPNKGWVEKEGMWFSNDEFFKQVQTYPTHRPLTGHGTNMIKTDNVTDPARKVYHIYCRGDRTCLSKGNLNAEGFCPECEKKQPKKIVSPSSNPTTTENTTTGVKDNDTEGNGTNKKGYRESPYTQTVGRAREVARTEGPFRAIEFIKTKAKEPASKDGTTGLSTSQYKKLTKEFQTLHLRLINAKVYPKHTPLCLPGD